MSTVQIKASDVAALRARTGAGMGDCKKALEEAGGDRNKGGGGDAADRKRRPRRRRAKPEAIALRLKDGTPEAEGGDAAPDATEAPAAE